MGSCVCHFCADGSKTDDTQFLSLYFTACKGLFALFRCLRNLGICGIFLTPCKSSCNISGSQEEPCQNQLLYAVCIGSRSIKYHDSLFGTFIQRDIIHTGSGTAYGQKSFRKLQLMHGGAAHQNRICLCHLIGKGIICREQLSSAGSNWI